MFEYLRIKCVDSYHWIMNMIHPNGKTYFPSVSTPQAEKATTNLNRNPMTALQDISPRSRATNIILREDEYQGASIKLPKKKPVTEVKINHHNKEALYQDESGCSGFEFMF